MVFERARYNGTNTLSPIHLRKIYDTNYMQGEILRAAVMRRLNSDEIEAPRPSFVGLSMQGAMSLRINVSKP